MFKEDEYTVSSYKMLQDLLSQNNKILNESTMQSEINEAANALSTVKISYRQIVKSIENAENELYGDMNNSVKGAVTAI